MDAEQIAASLTKAQRYWLLQRAAGNQAPWPRELFKDVGLPLHRANLVWWVTAAGENVTISDKGVQVATILKGQTDDE